MANYASLQSSIDSAVEQYETYKSQSLRLKLDNVSLEKLSPVSSPTKSHAKRASLSIPILSRLGSSDGKPASRSSQPRTQGHDSDPSSPLQSPFNATFTGSDRRPASASIHASSPAKKEFASFISVATDYETTNHILDLDFLLLVFDFMRIEHPYTSNSLQKSIKARNTAKKRLWNSYTAEMQGLARAYASGKPLPVSPGTAPLGSSEDRRRELKDRKAEVTDTVSRLEAAERTCAESIVSATAHLYAQAIKDIHARYSMPDPINDKTTSVARHNERARVFNELIKFVSDDLHNLERVTKSSTTTPLATQKKKGSAGVVEAVNSLCVQDYPPYGK
ncbi:protein of unknown function [Taphrina deformans PYCC 5710]|uniref:Uncharacterized protein n=1 Tax=Taphrina deformans (strain PYCC 5710 / ATCC 11124 / CBS 356.35 / IMI 108563 / JCM 9778 / NBRC 8474) TaxID=1097556 RepID=R4XFK8_TAPDE|nr:protein of unknown function [Taphrina deformans PYCC 5710]|eukprot:CCG84463.1 protein of unknown function [Taphrina deformans PYCC 5710]